MVNFLKNFKIVNLLEISFIPRIFALKVVPDVQHLLFVGVQLIPILHVIKIAPFYV